MVTTDATLWHMICTYQLAFLIPFISPFPANFLIAKRDILYLAETARALPLYIHRVRHSVLRVLCISRFHDKKKVYLKVCVCKSEHTEELNKQLSL